MGKAYIICVDDEMIILHSLREQLELEFGDDYNIEIAESGNEALDLFKELLEDGKEIPLIISDYMMPDIKGDELLEQVMGISPRTISILLTGHATLKGIKKALNNAGIYRYLPKPWNKECLYSAVNEALIIYDEKQKKLDSNKKLGEINLCLQKEVQENDEKIKKNKKILESIDRLSAINQMTEELSHEVSCSLEDIKTGIETIQMQQDKVSKGDPQSIVAYMENVHSFYKTASDVIDNLVVTFGNNMIKYLTIPNGSDDFAKFLFKVSSMRSMLPSSMDALFNGRAASEKAPRVNVDKIAAWEDEEILLFNLDEVLFFSKESNSTVVVTKKGKYKVKEGLEQWENKLNNTSFFRCHRSYLVNLNYISKIMPWIGQNSHISKIDGFPYEIPISRNKIREMKKTLGI